MLSLEVTLIVLMVRELRFILGIVRTSALGVEWK
jgi:hypothetical protein